MVPSQRRLRVVNEQCKQCRRDTVFLDMTVLLATRAQEIYDGTQGSWHGAELPPSQAYTQFNNNTWKEQCDSE